MQMEMEMEMEMMCIQRICFNDLLFPHCQISDYISGWCVRTLIESLKENSDNLRLLCFWGNNFLQLVPPVCSQVLQQLSVEKKQLIATKHA